MEEETKIVEETVSKADYDQLIKEYNRLVKAFNKAMDIIGNEYTNKLAKQIFSDIDSQEK